MSSCESLPLCLSALKLRQVAGIKLSSSHSFDPLWKSLDGTKNAKASVPLIREETTMGTRLHLIGCASLAFGVIAATTPGHSQSTRTWVDPPPEAGAAPPPVLANPPAKETRPVTSQSPKPPAGMSAAAKSDESSNENATQQTKAASSVAPDTPPRKVATDRKKKRPARSVAESKERSKQASQRRDLADSRARSTRQAGIPDGRYSGLQIMTLRTIEFPDGRRVQILTRPQPEGMSRFVEAPY